MFLDVLDVVQVKERTKEKEYMKYNEKMTMGEGPGAQD